MNVNFTTETRRKHGELFEKALTDGVLSSVIEVHRALGPGLLESAYEECICYELGSRGLRFQRQLPVPVTYKGIDLDCGFRLDLLVEDAIIVESLSANNE